MSTSQSSLVIVIGLATIVAVLWAAYRFLRPFYWRITWCTLAVVIAGMVVSNATIRYANGMGGYKFGVDLVGGTILVYEVDPTKKLPDNYKPEQLAAALKRRIDPADLKNVTIRPVSTTRVEIILATGGAHQAKIKEQACQELIDDVKQSYPPPEGQSLDVPQGQLAVLAETVKKQHPETKVEEIENFINSHYKVSKERRD